MKNCKIERCNLNEFKEGLCLQHYLSDCIGNIKIIDGIYEESKESYPIKKMGDYIRLSLSEYANIHIQNNKLIKYRYMEDKNYGIEDIIKDNINKRNDIIIEVNNTMICFFSDEKKSAMEYIVKRYKKLHNIETLPIVFM